MEKKLKQSAAETEKQWHGVGLAVGIRIWRIEKFKVIPWPQDKQGTFYRGDSYIVLNTFKKPDVPDKLFHEIFFWIGSESTQDEYGTAAYKTVELDDHLHGDAPQHREVDGSESAAFLGLFKVFRAISGGIESGFHHVGPTQYETRLLHMRGTIRGGVVVRDVAVDAKSLNSSDVFLLDQGLKLYHFSGKYSNGMERMKAEEVTKQIQGERGSAKVIYVNEDDHDDNAKEFWKAFGGRKPIVRKVPDPPAYEPKLLQVTDSNWFWQLSVKNVPVQKSSLSSNDVFILDKGDQVFVWIGNKADQKEKHQGVTFGLKHLYSSNHPNKMATVSRLIEGHETPDFWALLK